MVVVGLSLHLDEGVGVGVTIRVLGGLVPW